MLAMNWKTWLHGLGSAFVGGGANVVATMAIDPEDFNISAGMHKVLTLWLASGLISAALYLKQSPLPQLSQGEKPDAGDTVHR
jgi:hypothetical protein